MSGYSKLMKSPLWRQKREDILILDNFACIGCGKKKNLQVHHLYYNDNLPWDYPDDALITLCPSCHIKEHNSCLKFDYEHRKSPFSFPFFSRVKQNIDKYKLKKKKALERLKARKRAKKENTAQGKYHRHGKYGNMKVTIDDYNELFDNKNK